MRNTVVAIIAALTLVAAVIAMPSSAQSQVIIVIGNGPAQPYYPPAYPYPYPYPQNRVVIAEPQFYPGYGYPAPVYGYSASYYTGYYRPYRYGW
jgi:hypothetical protein